MSESADGNKPILVPELHLSVEPVKHLPALKHPHHHMQVRFSVEGETARCELRAEESADGRKRLILTW